MKKMILTFNNLELNSFIDLIKKQNCFVFIYLNNIKKNCLFEYNY